MVPDSLILHAEDCQIVLRLQFAAEHSNVLIIMVEQLSGCSSTTNIHHIRVDLQSVCAAQAEPVTVSQIDGIQFYMDYMILSLVCAKLPVPRQRNVLPFCQRTGQK